MLASPLRGVGPGDRFDITWMPGFALSDGWSNDDFAQSIQTLLPGTVVRWPFEMIVGTNQILRVTAHYAASDTFYKNADLWQGRIDAQPLTIQFKK